MKHLLLAVLLVVTCTGVARAGEPRLIGTYDDWLTYIFIENGNKVCYMVSKPTKEEGDYSRRGEVFALVTHRPSEKTRDVVSFISGYTFKSASNVEVKVAGETFSLFTQDDTAWAADAATDSKLVDAIKKGSNMIMRGTSSRGTKTKDTFSLKGSSKAYKRITDECF